MVLVNPKNEKQLQIIRVVIPACNEEASIAKVLAAIPAGITEVIVVDNGSTDQTAARARDAGATVVYEARRGYGSACLRGLAQIQSGTDIVVFLDGDYSDYPEELFSLVEPIQSEEADLVIGSRVLGRSEPGALMPVQRFGNALTTRLIEWIWHIPFTDLGPFRAIRYESLQKLQMRDPNFGWTVEMQIKAARLGLRCVEVPVSYRRRIGVSKISGTVSGSIKAGIKILYLIFREAWVDLFSKRKS
jgi:glycosyltransferase involved in cell wall biosynthesis